MQFDITGMSCAACSARVEKAVSRVEGVTQCTVSLLTNSMKTEGTAPAERIIAAVEAAGYGASERGAARPRRAQEPDAADGERRALLRRLCASLCFLLPLMYLTMGHMMLGLPVPSFLARDHVAMGLMQLLLTAVVMVINQKFFIRGTQGLLHRAPNMDTLVSLGAAAAFGYSTVALFAMSNASSRGDTAAAMACMDEFYFESAAMILTLITVGKLLEARAKGKTTSAIRALLRLAPSTATVVRDGKELEIPAAQLRRGDIFLVRPAQSIPADGIILEGGGAVNEAALTGESLPVDKGVGDTVSAATLNQSGFLRCEATQVGEETTLSQIIRMVSDAAATRAPIAKIADRVSGIFVPVVMGIALVVTLIWLLVGREIGFALARGISVLVISCPCALGLATPVAIMVGSGVGAKNGILFKTAAALEQAGRVQIVALDKTGTITAGQPAVTDVLPAPGVTRGELLQTALTLESRSEHPLARAVVARCSAMTPEPLRGFEALAGSGLAGFSGEECLRGGNEALLSSFLTLPQTIRAQADALAQEGKTPLFFSRGERFLGIIAVADTIKEDSPEAIRELRELGLRVVMLTGDNERTARAIGRQAGVDEVIAGVLPEGKEAAVRALSQQGKVAMVGDGINDAPALTRADLGIAIGAGTDVAIDAADVVLLKSRLTDVAAAIRLGRGTLRNIHENLFWAFFYNSLGIPLAAGAFISLLGWQLDPMFGAAAMSLSSFCVVSNALRLNFLKIYKTSNKSTKKEKKPMKKTVKIEGMMCPHCEAHVKKALEALAPVQSAEVSHTAGTAVVTLAAPVEDALLRQTVEAAGYSVTGIE